MWSDNDIFLTSTNNISRWFRWYDIVCSLFVVIVCNPEFYIFVFLVIIFNYCDWCASTLPRHYWINLSIFRFQTCSSKIYQWSCQVVPRLVDIRGKPGAKLNSLKRKLNKGRSDSRSLSACWKRDPVRGGARHVLAACRRKDGSSPAVLSALEVPPFKFAGDVLAAARTRMFLRCNVSLRRKNLEST